MSFFGINFMQAGTLGVSIVANNLLSEQLILAIQKSGATWASDPKTAPLVGIGGKLAVTVGGSFVLRKFVRQPGLANAWALGGGIAIALDLITAYVLPALKMAPAAAATTTSGYEIGNGAAEEIGAGENMYADTMYGYERGYASR